MALPRTNLSSGGLPRTNLSGGIGGSAASFSTPSKPKPKRWVGALLSNIEEFARGIGPGVRFLATASYNDTDRALGNLLPFRDSKSFMADDLARAVGSDYKQRYGSWSKFKEGVATRPLDFLLDVATVATLGGAAAGTAPAKLTLAATKAGNSARVAGFGARALRRAGYVDRTPANLERAAKVYGVASKEYRSGEHLGLVRGVREVGTKAAERGLIREPLLRARKTNPVLHSRDQIVERLLGSTPIAVKAPVVGVAARAAAQGRKAPMLKRHVAERAIEGAEKSLRWLKQDELTAWGVLHQASGDAVRFLEDQVRMLDESAQSLTGLELEVNRARRAHLASDAVRKLVAQPTARVQRAVNATKQLADDVMQPIMENVVGMSREALLERRLLPERVAEGAYRTSTHPTDLQPTAAAVKAGREAARSERRRGRTARQVQGDLDRMRADRQRLAARLLRAAQELRARALAQDAARRELRGLRGVTEQDVLGAERHLDAAALDEALGGAPSILDMTVGSALEALKAEGITIRLPRHLTMASIRGRSVRELLRLNAAAERRGGSPVLVRERQGGRLAERAMTRDEALANAPERVRHLPEPGAVPSTGDVEAMLKRMRLKLTRGKFGQARKRMDAWIASIYNEVRYGDRAPSSSMRREEARNVARARAARKAKPKEELPGRGDMLKAIDAKGAWDPSVARMADTAGPYRKEYWTMVRNARADDARFTSSFQPGSLERRLADAGIHPTDPNLNPSGAFDEIGDIVGEWIGENVGAGSVSDIMHGAGAEMRGAWIADAQDAEAYVAWARRGDPNLPLNPTDDEVARGIGMALSPDDSAADLWTQRATVDAVANELLIVYENGPDYYRPSNFGTHRSPLEDAIGRALGVEDLTNGEEWAAAVARKLDEFGFDEEYRKLAAGLSKAQMLYAHEGVYAFRGERWIPDPQQTDFGTLLEFVPDLSPELRKKLEQQAALTPGERRIVQQAARKLEQAARQVERNQQQEAVLRRRLGNLAEPGRYERQLQEKAQQLEPMPLRGAVAPDGSAYRANEWVNPATGQLYRDELGAVVTQVPAGSYLPHRLPRERGLGGGGRQLGSVKSKPKAGAALTRDSTGSVFRQGLQDNEAVTLLDNARALVRVQYAADLYDVAIRDMGMPFDETMYAATGGPREWVVVNNGQVRGLADKVESLAGMFEGLRDLLDDEQLNAVVERVRTASEGTLSALGEAQKSGQLDKLTMIPRSYYEKLVGDLQQSSRFVRMMIDRPLDVFRSLVLFLRPAYYVNNIAGQNFLLAVKADGPMFVPKYVRWVAHRNKQGALQLLKRAAEDDATGLALWDQVLAKHAQPLHGASAGQVETAGFSAFAERMAMSGKRRQQIIAGMLRSPRTANELGAILSDDILREFRFIRLMQPHVKAAREAGETGEDAAIAMRLLDTDPVLKERMLEQTLFDLVDYRGMTPFEKRVIRRIVPFYGWMRGLTTWALELGYNDPARFLVTLQLPSIVGRADNAQWNDVVPTWMQGSIRLGAPRNGMQTVVNTQGLNPVSTLADVALLAGAAFSDQPVATLSSGATVGSLNPYFQSLVAGLNGGKELGTPYQMLMPGQTWTAQDNRQWPGFIGSALGGFIASTPQNQLYVQRKMAQQNPGGVVSTGVYQSPWWHYAASYAGLPIRNVNMAQALQRRQRDEATLAGEGAWR